MPKIRARTLFEIVSCIHKMVAIFYNDVYYAFHKKMRV